MTFPANPWLASALAVLIVSALPLVVTLAMARKERLLRQLLPGLSAFGAGAVFAAAVGHIIPEALRAGNSSVAVGLGVATGIALFWGIERVLAGHDHAHAHGLALGAPSAHDGDNSADSCPHLDSATARHSHSHRALVSMTFAGDALHNLVDGMLIAAGFLTGSSVGLLTLAAVALHELPRELGTFGLFLHGGVRPMRAVGFNLATAVISLIGAMITMVAGTRVLVLSHYLLPVAAGTYLYIALVAGRAALAGTATRSAPWRPLSWSALGIVVTMGGVMLG